ncbi:MAG: hypothetical protein JSU98_07455 [Gemmatimonadales bacterium]|nr:MAG: hypothetical protein JSU98_07455 [Gemmatimonadales bacterium]
MSSRRYTGRGLLLVTVGLLVAFPSRAQERWSASLFGGVAFPLGDFGDEGISEEAGLATIGFTLGSDLAMRIRSAPGLEWLSTVQGVTFGVAEGFLEDLPQEAEVDLGRYWGAQLMTGLRYTIGEAGTRVRISGQMVVGTMRAPNATVSVPGEEVELESFWEPVKGVSGGLGLVLGERMSVTARYETLFNPEISGELRYMGMVEEYEGEQAMSWLRITVGIQVW